jgi:cysteine desulfurase
MGVEPQLARGAVRLSVGVGNTAAEVDGFLQALGATLGRLRRLAAVAV